MAFVRTGKPQWYTIEEGGSIMSAIGNLQAKVNSARVEALSVARDLWYRVVKDSAVYGPPASDNSIFATIKDSNGKSTLSYGWFNYTGDQYRARERFLIRVDIFKNSVSDMLKNLFGGINSKVGQFSSSFNANKFLRRQSFSPSAATVKMQKVITRGSGYSTGAKRIDQYETVGNRGVKNDYNSSSVIGPYGGMKRTSVRGKWSKYKRI